MKEPNYDKKSKLAFGFALIFCFFLIETVNANAILPNKASPYVWAALVAGAAVSLGLGLYYRRLSRRT